MRTLCANPLMRSYDYGQSPYSRMDEFDSIEDFLSKRKKNRKAILASISIEVITNYLREYWGPAVGTFNSGYCVDWAIAVKGFYPNARLWSDYPEHVFVKIDDKFYDAETLNGSNSWEELFYYEERMLIKGRVPSPKEVSLQELCAIWGIDYVAVLEENKKILTEFKGQRRLAMDGDMFMQLPYQQPVHKVPATDPKDHCIGPCPHRNTQEVAIKGDSITLCLDCNQIIRTPYLNRGDWDANDFPSNNMEYNQLGSTEAEPIL